MERQIMDQSFRIKFYSMQAHTSISDGTLLKCCRDSLAFSSITNDGQQLSNLRGVWLDYLLNKSNYTTFETWVDAWRAFELYSRTTAVDQMLTILEDRFSGRLLRTITPTDKHAGYRVFNSSMGEVRIYGDGKVSGTKGDQEETLFAVTFNFVQLYWRSLKRQPISQQLG